MIEYNENNTKLLNQLTDRLKQEGVDIMKEDRGYMNSYIVDNILEAMGQWKESEYLSQYLTDKTLKILVDYDSEKNLLNDIIEFVIFQTEQEIYIYPLVLNYFISYDMIIDFAEDIEKEYIECECLSCGNISYYEKQEIRQDSLGYFVECPQCGATFNIDKN